MAQFEESKVINALHPEKAQIGKKYWYSDNILNLKNYVEEDDVHYIGELIFEIGSYYPFHFNRGNWQFLYPYEEPPKQRMTNRMLAEWLAKGNGLYCVNDDVYYTFYCLKEDLDQELEVGIKLCSWGSEEWVEPTRIIYDRDCCGMNIVED